MSEPEKVSPERQALKRSRDKALAKPAEPNGTPTNPLEFLPGQGAYRRQHNIQAAQLRIRNGEPDSEILQQLEYTGFLPQKQREYLDLAHKWEKHKR